MLDDLSPPAANADGRTESHARAIVAAAGIAAMVTAVGFAFDVGRLLSVETELLVAAVSLVALAATITALVRFEPPGRGLLAVGLAVTVLATGMFTVAFYRSQLGPPAAAAPVERNPQVVVALPPWQRQVATQQLTIGFGTGDKLPQGAFLLDPPRPGPDPYQGDVSIECLTDGKDEGVQNCTGKNARTWIAAPIQQRALVGTANGNALDDPYTCDESRSVNYEAEYLELATDKTYCVRKRGDVSRLLALRVVAFSTAQPIPTNVIIEAVAWSR